MAGSLYKGMALAPHEATGDSVTTLNSFVKQCGPVVTIDSDSPDSSRSYLIATSNYQAGQTAAKKLLDAHDIKVWEGLVKDGKAEEYEYDGYRRWKML